MEWNGGKSGRKVRSLVEGELLHERSLIIDDDDM